MDREDEALAKELAAAGPGNAMEMRLFTASIDLAQHPLIKAKKAVRARYYAVLDYFVNRLDSDTVLVQERLLAYRKAMLGDAAPSAVTENFPLELGRWKYRYVLLCDLALILVAKGSLQMAYSKLAAYLNRKQSRLLGFLRDALLLDAPFKRYPVLTQQLIQQYRENRRFWNYRETRFLITANMSAGKSTLLNALTGKVVSSMKSEATTAALHSVYDKPFQDGRTSAWDGVFTMDADERTLLAYNAQNTTGKVYVSTYFATFVKKAERRFCLIDTPGVNSAMNGEHGRLTRKALQEETFDKLVYVFNANRLGTDEEMRHLKFVAEHVPKDKVIFVLNKLDAFNKKYDSIEASLANIKKDLLAFGYERPRIYPISAYFALLVKKRLTGEILTEDEQDSYALFAKKFGKPEYDISRYYPFAAQIDGVQDGKLAAAAVQCGLYGLESVLYGGMDTA